MSDARAATDAGLRGVEPADEHEIADALQATAGLHAACITRVCAGGIRALVARIRELEARQVPDGWQVVPKEPTRAMHDASDEILSGPSWTGVVPPDCRFDDYVRKLEWAAMLAAAPRP